MTFCICWFCMCSSSSKSRNCASKLLEMFFWRKTNALFDFDHLSKRNKFNRRRLDSVRASKLIQKLKNLDHRDEVSLWHCICLEIWTRNWDRRRKKYLQKRYLQKRYLRNRDEEWTKSSMTQSAQSIVWKYCFSFHEPSSCDAKSNEIQQWWRHDCDLNFWSRRITFEYLRSAWLQWKRNIWYVYCRNDVDFDQLLRAFCVLYRR